MWPACYQWRCAECLAPGPLPSIQPGSPAPAAGAAPDAAAAHAAQVGSPAGPFETEELEHSTRVRRGPKADAGGGTPLAIASLPSTHPCSPIPSMGHCLLLLPPPKQVRWWGGLGTGAGLGGPGVEWWGSGSEELHPINELGGAWRGQREQGPTQTLPIKLEYNGAVDNGRSPAADPAEEADAAQTLGLKYSMKTWWGGVKQSLSIAFALGARPMLQTACTVL